ncbi:hypothetical protein M426DRAFT_21250 [Hypoxylon sp. CI-4A]|nr:hypothetical protein M426DRAFT_21250 [Hypoxylon sp. CI-4A]
MALPNMDTQAKISSEAAQNFVDSFYEALNRRRPMGNYYASTSPRLTSAGVKPDISINGLALADVAAYEALLETQGAPVTYDVASFDAQPVNPNFQQGAGGPADGNPAAAAAAAVRAGDRLSFALQVSGTVRYGRGHVASSSDKNHGPAVSAAPAVGTTDTSGGGGGAQEKLFNESFLLVPHWEAWGRNAPRNMRKWVIVSQNFRAL